MFRDFFFTMNKQICQNTAIFNTAIIIDGALLLALILLINLLIIALLITESGSMRL